MRISGRSADSLSSPAVLALIQFDITIITAVVDEDSNACHANKPGHTGLMCTSAFSFAAEMRELGGGRLTQLPR